jgi:hypothetical protein
VTGNTVKQAAEADLIDVDEVDSVVSDQGGELPARANGDGRLRGYLRIETNKKGGAAIPTLHFHDNGELDAFLDAIKQPVPQQDLAGLWKDGMIDTFYADVTSLLATVL